MSQQKAALVVGSGPGLGAALARRFASEGLITCVARRNKAELSPLCEEIKASGGMVHDFGLDAANESEVVSLLKTIEEKIAPLEVVVHNVGGFAHTPILKTTADQYRRTWEVGCLSGFVLGREAARHMVPRGKGSIFFTGATAGLRGSAGVAAFAGSKFALRALAQSMARELGPQGIHVAWVNVDGMIDTPKVREIFASYVESKGEDALLQPAAIAEAYWALHQQPRSAWTQEMDIRPYIEKW